jgi:RimJ/RimL family protein N-acetyltransferase
MQTFHPREIQLKNGTSILIRQAESTDAENLLNCLKTYIPQSEYIPKLEQEIKLTVSDEENWIRSFLESDNSLLLIAEHEHQIIGNIDLTGSRREMMAHTAVIGMGMLKEWRNSGLGTALISSVIEWAQQNPVLELIWLQVYTQNQPGYNLYKKMGFEENGIIKGFFKNKNGYFDNLTMTLKVK